jgi:membrane protease subunit (stomatin/prohibitin family)
MGLLDTLKQHYVEVIDWTEKDDALLVYRFPMKDREIPTGAQLTVRETQLALFLDEGQVADVFEPGRYVLTTKTLPRLAVLKKWDPYFRSPFKSDIFFFSTREQTNQKWGTPTPLTIRDRELGPIRIRAHGFFSYKIKNPRVFFEKISGTADQFSVADADGHLRSLIVSCLGSFFGGVQIPFIDMAANQAELSEFLRQKIGGQFADYGLTLVKFSVQSVSLPRELQSHFDKVASMRMVGDLQKYLLFQAAESLTTKTETKEGLSSALGVGLGLGLGGLLRQGGQPPQTPAPTAAPQPAPPTKEVSALPSPDDTVATLAQLHELQKKGLLTQEEFEAKVTALFRKKPAAKKP